MTKRRQLLKSIGAIGIAGVAPPVSGLEDDEELEYRGVTYDSTTLQAQGECSVTIKGGESNRFLMNIPGHEVAFSAELNSKEGDPARASARTKAHDLGNQGGEVLLRSTFQGPYFTGIITRPSREYGNLGFTMMGRV